MLTKLGTAIGRWMVDGETGLSSECMAAVALGAKRPKRVHWPLDPADFNRCLKLVKAAPGVRKSFPDIAALCKQWRSCIDHWDELERMFVAEVGWDWSKAKSAKKTYDRMKELGL